MKRKNSKNKTLHNYAKYSGIAMQMIAIILAGVFGGIKLDEFLKLETPIFTIILAIIAVVLAMYFVIKDLIKFK